MSLLKRWKRKVQRKVAPFKLRKRAPQKEISERIEQAADEMIRNATISKSGSIEVKNDDPALRRWWRERRRLERVDRARGRGSA